MKIVYIVAIIAILFMYSLFTTHKIYIMRKEKLHMEHKINLLTEENIKLLEQIKLNEKKYQIKVDELLQRSIKPIKIIKIPQIVEKTVTIKEYECQQLGVMIDEAISDLSN